MPSERPAEAFVIRFTDARGQREQVIDGLATAMAMRECGERPLFLVSDVACQPPYVASIFLYIDVKRHLHAVALPEEKTSQPESARADLLGQKLAHAVRATERERIHPLAEYRYAPLMTIQSGWRGVEPLFCIPGAGANVVDLIPFAGAIGEKHCPTHIASPISSMS